MGLVLSKFEEDFTSFQSKYLEANNIKCHLLTRSGNFLHINVGGGGGRGEVGEGRGDQLSSGKDDELLGILIDQKQTFEDQLLNIIQKTNK